jgi:sodium-dependent dicarboxylate transporter 2/3/5
MEQTSVASHDRKASVGVIGAIAATVSILLLPSPEGLSVEGHRLAALFVGILILWATEALPIAITALLALIFQPILSLGTLGMAFGSFISPVFFFVIVMFLIALAWLKTGLARRFALWMISRAGTDSKRVLYVFVFGSGLISMTMSDVPSAALFMAIAMGIFAKLGLKPGSPFAKSIMIGIPVGALIGGVGTPAGSAINILGLIVIEQNGGPPVPFLSWMAIGIPMVIVLLPIAAWILGRFFSPEISSIGTLDGILEERRQLGPISPAEWKVITIVGILMVLWILNTWVPALDVTLVAMCGGCAMFLPGVRLFSWQEAQASVGWDILMMLGGVTTLGAASSRTGLAQWLVDSALGGLGSVNVFWILILISAFTVLIHLILPVNPVIVAVMIPPIMLLAQSAGANPALYALPIAFTTSCAFLLPLDPVPLITFSKGYYKMMDMFVPGLVISVVWVIVMTVVMLLIAPLVGLICSELFALSLLPPAVPPE